MMSFDTWLIKQGLSEKTARNYVGAIKHDALSTFLKIIIQPHFDANQLNGGPFFANFCRKFDPSGSIVAMNDKGHDMYRCALVKYVAYNATQSIRPPKMLFPEGLLDWAGHRDGGVRRPFNDESGRPTGSQIPTPLTVRLSQWASDLVAGEKVPRVILLVGGPGNGKTDAVEGCIQALDDALTANGKLFQGFASQYKDAHISPPRRAEIELKLVIQDLPSHLDTTICLVQDATERDSQQNLTPQELLLKELTSIANKDNDCIYLACVNRGILAKSMELAEKIQANPTVIDRITAMIACVTLDANPMQCWPLEDDPNVAIWPMDVESLIDPALSEDGQTVGHHIFRAALFKEFWKPACDLGSRCPFCENRRLLERPKALDNLISFLYYFELSSGKRWTFRDLFSLISYLLVGNEAELQIDRKRCSPCQWSKEQSKRALTGKDGSVEKDRASYLLASRLYHHRLFPLWPALSKGEHKKSMSIVGPKSLDAGIRNAYGFTRFTRFSKEQTSNTIGDIPKLIVTKFSRYIDPALMSNQLILSATATQNITVHNLEDRFSLSVKDGAALVKGLIHPLEQDILNNLILADESLGLLKNIAKSAKSATVLQNSIRRFSSKLSKRSMGTEVGICFNKTLFDSYSEIVASDTQAINSARKGLKRILNGRNNKFQAELTTTFGQPVAQISKQVTFNLDTPINVKSVDPILKQGYPKTYLPFLQVEGHHIPITFTLFEALDAVEKGLFLASLSPEVYSLLDRVKALISGRVIRDKAVLDEDPTIYLGKTTGLIEISNGRFIYSEGSII